MQPRRLYAACLLVGLAGSCTGDDLSLDVGAPDDGFEEIRRRLPIRILAGPTGYAGEPPCDTSGCSPDAFENVVSRACVERVLGNPVNPCDVGRAQSETWVCTANTLLEVIDSPSAREVRIGFPSTGSGGTAGTVLVPPQDAESNVELARLALHASGEAIRLAADAFDATRTPGCTDEALRTVDPVSGIPFAARLAYFYREATELAYAASERMSLASAAVSDSAYSRLPDGADAAAFITADFASRTAAAHLIVGGDHGLGGLSGVAEDGFFSRATLTGEGQRALEWFRAAAIDPVLIADDSRPRRRSTTSRRAPEQSRRRPPCASASATCRAARACATPATPMPCTSCSASRARGSPRRASTCAKSSARSIGRARSSSIRSRCPTE